VDFIDEARGKTELMGEGIEIGALGGRVGGDRNERGGVDFGGVLGGVGALDNRVDVERTRQLIEDERLPLRRAAWFRAC
jgi:hypothetical protein